MSAPRAVIEYNGNPVSPSNALPTSASGAATVTPIAATTYTIATGGTAVTVFAANSIVNLGIIQNPSTATESLFVNLITNAGTACSNTTFELPAGQSFGCPPSSIAVTANAVTTGHVFAATSL